MKRSHIAKWYNNQIDEKKYSGYYEHFRWLDSVVSWVQYKMTFDSLWSKIENLNYNSFMEFGPGPGTWTKLFLYKHPKAKYTLIDISKKMIMQNEINLGNRNNLKRVNADILAYPSNKKFNFVFSSRAIEYIPEKKELANKIFELLTPNGSGIIITKKPWRKNAIEKEHSFQISDTQLKRHFQRAGFKSIKIFPVSFIFPFSTIFPSVFIKLSQYLQNKELGWFARLFIESYMIVFSKKA